MAIFLGTYHGYTWETAIRLPWRIFWRLCPPVDALAQESRDDHVAEQRRRVIAMRQWREERARKIAERQGAG